MHHYQFERAARARRRKALLITFAFHALLIVGISFDWQSATSQVGSDVVVDFGNGQVTLADTDLTDLSAADFFLYDPTGF